MSATGLYLDAIVTLVDARHIGIHLDEHEAEEQIAFADVIVINKIDLVDERAADALEETLRSMNASAVIHRATYGALDISEVLDIGRFSASNALDVAPDLLQDVAHEHDSSVSSICISRQGVVDAARFSRWTFELGQQYARRLFRIKGVLNVDDAPRRFLFQGVHMTFDGHPGKPWRSEPRLNQLVLIGRHLDRQQIEAQFRACLR